MLHLHNVVNYVSACFVRGIYSWHDTCMYHSVGWQGADPSRQRCCMKATKPAPVVTPPVAPSKPAKVRKIKVLKTDAKFRGAREAWYAVLKAHDGKTVEEFEKACTDKPPSLPKSLRPEAPSGWTRYFKKTGIMDIVEA